MLGIVFLVGDFFRWAFEYFIPLFLDCKLSTGKSMHSFLKFLLYMMNHFSLAAFRTLCLTCENMIIMCLSIYWFIFGFVLVGICLPSWIWMSFYSPRFREFSPIIFSKSFVPFSYSSSSRNSVVCILGLLMHCPEYFKLSSICHSFFLSFFWLDNITWLVFEFSDSFLCLIKSAIEPFYW